MYESAIIILNGVKYLLTYNVNALRPTEIKKLVDEHHMRDDTEALKEVLIVDFDSELTEYEELETYDLDKEE